MRKTALTAPSTPVLRGTKAQTGRPRSISWSDMRGGSLIQEAHIDSIDHRLSKYSPPMQAASHAWETSFFTRRDRDALAFMLNPPSSTAKAPPAPSDHATLPLPAARAPRDVSCEPTVAPKLGVPVAMLRLIFQRVSNCPMCECNNPRRPAHVSSILVALCDQATIDKMMNASPLDQKEARKCFEDGVLRIEQWPEETLSWTDFRSIFGPDSSARSSYGSSPSTPDRTQLPPRASMFTHTDGTFSQGIAEVAWKVHEEHGSTAACQVQMCESSLAASQKQLGDNHICTALEAARLAAAYATQGRHESVRELVLSTLNVCLRKLSESPKINKEALDKLAGFELVYRKSTAVPTTLLQDAKALVETDHFILAETLCKVQEALQSCGVHVPALGSTAVMSPG